MEYILLQLRYDVKKKNEVLYSQMHLNTIIYLATKINKNSKINNSHNVKFIQAFIDNWELLRGE